MTARAQQGFSLVELSIVLVILGLLTGGILAGQSLIRASELRAVSTESSRFATAMGTFRDKFFAAPGDFTKAADFGWGATGGNGDGVIANTAAAGTNEIATFWLHLALAGLIEGSYANIAGITPFVAGTNNPRSKLGQAGWNIIGLGSVGVDGVTSTATLNTTDPAATTFFTGSYGNALLFGAGTSAILPTGALKAEEAWNIDTKMDDGRPDLGSVLTLESQGENDLSRCSDQDGAVTAIAASNYALSNTSSNACSLVIKTGY